MTLLITNGSATSDAHVWQGGKGVFAVVGTWSGATITLQALGPDETTWIDAGTTAILTEDGIVGFDLAGGQIRAEVVGSPSGIYASVIENPRSTK